MEVLNKLRNTVSNTISNTVNSTAYGLSQLSSVLPGNPVTREFEASAQVASAGPGLLWKVYSGYKKSTRQEASIFVFEKRMLDGWSSKQEREAVLDTLKRGVTQLTKLRHPRILTVQHPLEESRDSLAFATEPVFASLANALGNLENISQPPANNLGDYKLLDVEIRYGLLQLGEGLAFLHGDVKLLHRNICPESIVINKNGAWKIFGFDSCALNRNPNDKQPSWSYVEYDPTIPAVGQPRLDYQAPECVVAGSCSPSSDIFSLGMLAYVLHSPGNRPLHESHGDVAECRRFFADFKSSLATTTTTTRLASIPDSFRDTVKLMLSGNPELRPDAHQFTKIDYFMDIGVRTLNYLDKLFQWDNLQKSQFYKGLPEVTRQLPHRVVLHRILPCLYKEFVNPPMIPFVLPTILRVLESCTTEEFTEHVLPNLKPVLAIEEPPQISLVLMQRIDLLLKLCSAEVIKNDIVPLLTRALDSRLEQLRELCLSALPSTATLIESPSMRNVILPRIKKLCLAGPADGGSLSVRVNCLLCLAKMLENLDRWLVLDQVLPFLQEIPHAGEPAVLMAIIGIYKMVLTHGKLGISKEVLATQVLPFLLPLCIEQSLSPSQFEALASLVGDMINRVTSEHREALRQLDAVRREARQLDDALMQTGNSSSATSVLDQVFPGSDLSSSSSSSPSLPISTSSSTPAKDGKGLSMEEKHRLARQQESHQRLKSQSPMTPRTATRALKSEPRDLTSTLIRHNFNQLNLSTGKSTNSQANYSAIAPSPAAWQTGNANRNQWKGTETPVSGSHEISNVQNNAINWSGNGTSGSINWDSRYPTSNWDSSRVSNPIGRSDGNFSSPGSNVPTMSLLLGQQVSPQERTRSNLSTQDIIDFLS